MSGIPWWRRVDKLQRADFLAEVHNSIKQRAEEGERKYKSSEEGFQR